MNVRPRLAFTIALSILIAAAAFADPYAKRVVDKTGFTQRENGAAVHPGDYDTILGPPQPGRTPGRVPKLGSGGEIIVDMGQGDEIFNQGGPDLKIWESGAPENYWVLAAQQLSGPWEFIGYGKGSATFDFEGSRLPWARYIALADLECVDEGEGSEAADFDAVEALNRRTSRQPMTPPIPPAGRCLIGRWRYDGRFNTKPTALGRLLKSYDSATLPPVPSSFSYVDSETPQEFNSCAVIFMTGHRDFTLSEPQRQALREYVLRGGFLLADSCCANRAFADAFHREMNAIFPEMPFQRLDPSHEVYGLLEKVDARTMPLDAKFKDGIPVIIFSPSGLVCAWEEMRCPRNHPTPPPADALRLGVNIILYALTN